MKVTQALPFRAVLAFFALLFAIAVSAQTAGDGLSAPANAAPPAQNPLRIALLRWYNANQTTSFAVGSQPYGVAFDGANIWTANFGDGTVSKVRANDGTVLGTFRVGFSPIGVTFDGANIWVSDNATNNVFKLRASDGATLGTFTIGGAPYGIAFDGSHIWVGGAPQVDELRPSDGATVAVFDIPGTNVTGIAFDGANVWLSGLTDGRIYKF
jgi:DNA-binding beta-propeller fold protein YncE